MGSSSAVLDRARGAAAYRRAAANPELERVDFCDPERLEPGENELADIALAAAAHPSGVLSANVGDRVLGGGRVLKEIRGMGKVYDWRASSWTPVNGGKIKPLVMVQHIPVVPNMVGIADFVRLRDVLVAQGLMVQGATDREGNVALFTPYDSLCFQARGANQQSCGIEHMHLTVGEAWTKHQLRAAAWHVQLANRKHGMPLGRANLAAGPGVVRVLRRGQTTHEAVSDFAGFHDRIDPGHGFDFEYVEHCVRFFRNNDRGHFEGA
jgi:hypothetical protein